MKKISNIKQMEKLVELMTANTDMGRDKLPFGANKAPHKQTWEKFSLEFHCIHPLELQKNSIADKLKNF